MTVTIFIGVAVGLILLCRIAATPINEYIFPKQSIIEIEPQIQLNFTPNPVKEPIKVIKYPEIHKFLTEIPDCDWCSACGSYARYTRLNAEKQGIRIGEITITDPDRNRVQRLVMDGHRINYFYADDGHRVYIDNLHDWGIILEFNEIHEHIQNKFGFNLSSIGFKDQKIT